MAAHHELGKDAERLACGWLKQQGFQLLHFNWRFSYYEIDIIAERNGVLHFIEVKARNVPHVGFPEESVTRKKFKRLQQAADEYLFRHPGYRWISYDILAISIHRHREPDYFFLEDVFL